MPNSHDLQAPIVLIYDQSIVSLNQLDPDISTKLAPLHAIFLAQLEKGDAGGLPFCQGVLLALEALTPPDRTYNPKLPCLLARLSGIDLVYPSQSLCYNFFPMAARFKSRPNALTEIYDLVSGLNELRLDGDEGLASVLKAVVFLSGNDLSGDPERMITRFQLISHNFKRYVANAGGSCYLKAAGSDWHLGGQQVAFLRYPGGVTKVYKPRSLSPDWAFYELLAYFNRRLPDYASKYALPLPQVPVMNPGWGIESFVERVQAPMTEAQAGNYYVQMGALLFLTKLLGLADAHQDNVIPTAAGPVIIDTECCFLPDVMKSDRLGSTCLFDALTQLHADDPVEFAAAVFSIGEEVSAQVYMRYRLQIIEGFVLARNLLTEKESELTATVLALWSGVEQIRYVPLKTSGFISMISCQMETRPKEVFFASTWVVEIISNLESLLGYLLDEHSKNLLYSGMCSAFQYAGIPSFHFQKGPDGKWKLYCETQLLAANLDIFGSLGLDGYLRHTLDWLKSDAPIAEIERRLT